MASGDSSDVLDVDTEWEQFQRSGCPDFMLMSRYVNGFVHNYFPYMPFKAASDGRLRPGGAGVAAAEHGATSADAPQQQFQQEKPTIQASHTANASETQQAAARQQQRQQHHGDEDAQQPRQGATSASMEGHGVNSPLPIAGGGCGPPLKGLWACGVCAAPEAQAHGKEGATQSGDARAVA